MWLRARPIPAEHAQPAPRRTDGVVGVNYSIARKEPAPARGGSLFFMKDNNLVVENPRQKKLPFDVSRSDGEARDPLAQTERTAPRGV